MNGKDLSKIEQKYFKMKLNRLIDEQMILDEECHREVISGLNDMLRDFSDGNSIDFTKKSVMKGIVLDIFPEMFFLQPDFGSEIYVSLLSYYDFLYTEKILSKDDYLDMLLFFQQNMYPFFKKLAKAAENTETDLSEIIEDLFISEGLTATPKLVPKNNVIQMPGLQKQAQGKRLFQFRIDLEGFSPLVWRRVVVPSDISFATFHRIIQALFEWENCHLHLFQTKSGAFGNLESDSVEESTQAKLGELPLETLEKMTYIYDFGEDWYHKIVLEKVHSEGAVNYPQPIYCVKTINDAPLEDSRGTGEMGHSTLKEINGRLSSIK